MRTDLLHAARLARVDLLLLSRNMTALFTVALLPLMMGLVFVGIGGREAPTVRGVPSELFVSAALPALMLGFSVFVNLVNVFTARREELVLKRLRGGVVSATGILGGVALGAFAVYLAQAAVLVGLILFYLDGPPPANLPLWLLGGVLGAVMFALLAAALSGVTRNAELAQVTVLPPLLAMMVAAPFYAPLEAMPQALRIPAEVLPVTPLVELMRTAYLGRDFVGGQGEPLGFGAQWVAVLPSLGHLLVWVAVGALLARWLFRWEPRHG